jgi:hypothetical protein
VSGDVVTFVGLGFLITTKPFGETDGRFGGSEELGGPSGAQCPFQLLEGATPIPFAAARSAGHRRAIDSSGSLQNL